VTVWQIAAGDGPERDYAEPVFLRYGVAAVGPGDPGPYDEYPERYAADQEAYRPFMRPFCEEVGVDDLLILKRPLTRTHWHVVAIGRVESSYDYELALEDVEGWDLQHVLRVRWRVLPKPLETAGLVRGTLKRVNKPELRELARKLWEKNAANERQPEELPDRPPELSDDALIGLLIDYGLASTVAETIAVTIRRLRRLADWYAREGGTIGEHEIRAFLVAPLLLALGWPEQRMRIEYARADIALWDRPFNQAGAEIERIVETKHIYNALGPGPAEQAAAYAARYGNCHTLIVTDGLRYKLFRRSQSRARQVEWEQAAYANLLKLRAHHPLDPAIGGAGDLFLGLLP
jgi:hypothetical protein